MLAIGLSDNCVLVHRCMPSHRLRLKTQAMTSPFPQPQKPNRK